MRRWVAGLLLLAAPAYAVVWEPDYQQGLEKAQKEKRPVLLDFYADWCGWCKVLDREVYQHPDMAEQLAGYVCIKINVDKNPKAAYAYQVSSLPRTIVLNQEGRIVGDQIGYMPRASFKAFLDRTGELDTTEAPPAPIVRSADGSSPTPAPALKPEARTVPELVAQLADPYLGARIEAYEQLRKKATNTPPYDPWADGAARAAALEVWQTWSPGAASP